MKEGVKWIKEEHGNYCEIKEEGRLFPFRMIRWVNGNLTQCVEKKNINVVWVLWSMKYFCHKLGFSVNK